MPTTAGIATEFITFSRASLATVTDADGKIKWAPHNLITHSEQLDNTAWQRYTTDAAITMTANAALAPDGTTTAERINLDAVTSAGDYSIVRNTFTATPGTYTLGIWLKAFSAGDVGKKIWFYGLIAPTFYGIVPAVLSNDWQLITTTITVPAGILEYSFGTIGSTYGGENQGAVSFLAWGAHAYRSDLGGMQANTSAYPFYNPTTPKNRLGYTESFENAAWIKSQISAFGSGSVSNAIVAPNGLQTATLLQASSTNAVAYQVFSTIANGTYTISVYAKAGTITSFDLGGTNQGVESYYARFNLSAVTATNISGGTIPSIISVGDGWYRCSVRKTVTAGNANDIIQIHIGNANATVAGNSIYVWGAQVSDSASVDPYIGNSFAAPVAGAYHGPRRDFDPVTLACRGLLVEEQRTNLALQSNNFADSAVWFSGNATIAATGGTAPDGTNNANVFTMTAAGAYTFQNIDVTGGTAFTASVWVKGVGSSIGKTGRIWFWYAGTATGSNAITNFTLTSSWQRVSVTSTPTGSGSVQVRIDPEGVNTATVGDVVHLYGAQVEINYSTVTPYLPSPSSYIPTLASAVTRSVEYASVSLTSIPYSTTEGSIVIHCSLNGGNELTAYRRPFSLEGTPPGGYQIGATYVYDSNWRVFDDATIPGKHGVAFKADDHAVVANGGAARTGTGSFTGSSYNILRLGSTDANWYLNGHIRNITYMPRRLTNAELQTRTT